MAAFVHGYEEPTWLTGSAPSSRHTGVRCRPGGRAGGHGSQARPTLQAGNEPWPPRLGEQRDTGIAAGPVVLAAVSLGEPTSDASR